MVANQTYFPYAFEEPWPKPGKECCTFYHTLDLSDGTSVVGPWDIRGRFHDYIGRYNLRGKTVLDVGTASGFLAFEAEKAGATVTATDARSATELERLPFKNLLYHQDREAWAEQAESWLVTLKNGFWYAWHGNNSKVDVIYAPLDRLPYWRRRFDVVIAGAILEHLANPIGAIGNMAALANEAVIIAFTPVADTDEQVLQTVNDWSDSADLYSYTWWVISRALYIRVFDNLGFDIEFTTAFASIDGQLISRPTIVARRRRG